MCQVGKLGPDNLEHVVCLGQILQFGKDAQNKLTSSHQAFLTTVSIDCSAKKGQRNRLTFANKRANLEKVITAGQSKELLFL